LGTHPISASIPYDFMSCYAYISLVWVNLCLAAERFANTERIIYLTPELQSKTHG
jgi:hypothetical protein